MYPCRAPSLDTSRTRQGNHRAEPRTKYVARQLGHPQFKDHRLGGVRRQARVPLADTLDDFRFPPGEMVPPAAQHVAKRRAAIDVLCSNQSNCWLTRDLS